MEKGKWAGMEKDAPDVWLCLQFSCVCFIYPDGGLECRIILTSDG